MNPPLTRRNFIKRAALSVPAVNTLLQLRLAGDLAAADTGPDDYRALVCLFFPGGIDSFNLLIPRGSAEYAEYAGIRQDLAIPNEHLLPLSPSVDPGLELGLHPGLAGIKTLFEEGAATFVANVGTLIEPITKAQFESGSVRSPLGLFSHSDQIEQWQTSLTDTRSARGWAGRAADLLSSLNSSQEVPMNISLAGNNVWQSGQNSIEYTVGPDGAESLAGYDREETSPWSLTPIRTRAIDEQLATSYDHLLTEAFQRKRIDAMAAYERFNSATDLPLPSSVTWPDSWFSRQMQRVAKSIAGQAALGHRRQTFFVQYGGWDHHDEVIRNMAGLVPGFDRVILAFYRSLQALGLSNDVTLFTASDFGRTLTSNGAGSDHAWGGNSFVVGGAVHGGRIYGNYPDLYEDNPLDVGRGRIIPTTSVDSYFAELALWLGVSRTDLPLVLPNIGTFFAAGGSGRPVGFLP